MSAGAGESVAFAYLAKALYGVLLAWGAWVTRHVLRGATKEDVKSANSGTKEVLDEKLSIYMRSVESSYAHLREDLKEIRTLLQSRKD